MLYFHIDFSDILSKNTKADQLDPSEETDNTDHAGPSGDRIAHEPHDDRPDHPEKAQSRNHGSKRRDNPNRLYAETCYSIECEG